MSATEYISDYELVEKLHLSDINAFDQIFKRYSGKLYGFTFRYLKSKEETEGLVQDVFLKIWENRKSIKKETSLKSYLFTITYHNICHVFRKRQIYLKIIERIDKNTVQLINLEEQIDYKSALRKIELLIDKLPEKQKTIFLKSRKEGKSTLEIAEEMHLAPGTIDNIISATIKYLRKKISAFDNTILFFYFFYLLV
jgi:RNA polymerase sigma-70 factor (family 1)